MSTEEFAIQQAKFNSYEHRVAVYQGKEAAKETDKLRSNLQSKGLTKQQVDQVMK